MGKINLLSKAIDVISSSIRTYDFLCLSRNDPKYFTRKGKIGFLNLITFTLNFVKKSLQFEIDSFFKLLNSDVSITKQAFSQARQKISYEPFKVMFNTTAQLARSEEGMDTFKGLHVSAIDGTAWH